MNWQNLKTPQVKGIILGIIVAVMLTGFRIPPAFALVVGVIFGVVAFFVLDENKKKKCRENNYFMRALKHNDPLNLLGKSFFLCRILCFLYD